MKPSLYELDFCLSLFSSLITTSVVFLYSALFTVYAFIAMLYVRVTSLQPVVNARLHDLQATPCPSGSR